MNPMLKVPERKAGDPEIAIRNLASHADLVACVALQREVWGAEFADCVPPALLKVTQRVGGLAAGAFDEGGTLLGFVYGITGMTGGRSVHWSHMLAVLPRARGVGIGRRLKEHQRQVVAEAGVEAIQWSFDPLVSRNAHLNLNHLRAEVAEYVESMYPPMASKLHGTLPIDRLIVEWPTVDVQAASKAGSDGGSPGGGEPAGGKPDGGDADGAVVLDWRNGGDGGSPEPNGARAVRIAVPRDFEELVQSSPTTALEIRMRTRDFFVSCLGNGYRIGGFDRGRTGDPHYLLYRS